MVLVFRANSCGIISCRCCRSLFEAKSFLVGDRKFLPEIDGVALKYHLFLITWTISSMLFFVSPIFPCMAAAAVTPPGLVTAAAELVLPCLEGDVV